MGAWQYVKNSFLEGDEEMSTMRKNNNIAETDIEKANLMIEQYASISNNLPLADGYGPHYQHVIIKNYWNNLENKNYCSNNKFSKLYNKEQIKKAIINSNSDASPGLDNIYNKQIKEMLVVQNGKILNIIEKMINWTRKKRYFPDDWAKSAISPHSRRLGK